MVELQHTCILPCLIQLKTWQHLKHAVDVSKEFRKPFTAHPVWIERCRDPCGEKTRDFIRDNGLQWDVQKLAQIIRGSMRDVFAEHLGFGDESRAKEFLETLLQVAERRNTRAHGDIPTEPEVLEALKHMKNVLLEFEPQKATEIGNILQEAQRLVHAARYSPTLKDNATVNQEDFLVMALFLGLNDFEKRLEVEAGEWDYNGGTITFRNAQDWSDDQTARFKLNPTKDRLKLISEARHWLLHNTSAEPDIPEVLTACHAVLHDLSELQSGLPPRDAAPENWWDQLAFVLYCSICNCILRLTLYCSRHLQELGQLCGVL